MELADIEAAARRIRGAIRETPCRRSDALREATGVDVWLKFENLQRTGSFKERGALNRLLLLTEEERERGVVCASAGNHAQAVAYHATRLGIRSTIVMPRSTPLNKISSTTRLGGTVVLDGETYDDAEVRARAIVERDGATLVHAFDDEAVIAGQGTLALEIRELGPERLRPDAVLVPVGGGGLVAGVGLALRAFDPSVTVIAVEPERCAAMAASLAAGVPTPTPLRRSIADGLAVKTPGRRTFEIAREVIDGTVAVGEDEIAGAILMLLEREKTVVEGAGAVGVAALLHRAELRESLAGKVVVVPLCGGNIDVNVLSRIIERGLAEDGRLGKLRVFVPDRPGALAAISRSIADAGANVMEIVHTRSFAQTELGDVAVDVVVETRGREHLDDVVRGLVAEGFETRLEGANG